MSLAQSMNFSSHARERLVAALKAEGIKDGRVLKVMGQIPRELFLPKAMASQAYDNAALPIGEKQTISQPLVVAAMTEALSLRHEHKVLEIGTGSGYQAAILGCLCRRLFTVERIPSLYEKAGALFHELGFTNIVTKLDDGAAGWPEQAPFDRILLTCASPDVPEALIDQLAPNGIMVMPLGRSEDRTQELVRLTKDESGGMTTENLGRVHFVPLVSTLKERKAAC